jgi:hypothetical protein
MEYWGRRSIGVTTRWCRTIAISWRNWWGVLWRVISRGVRWRVDWRWWWVDDCWRGRRLMRHWRNIIRRWWIIRGRWWWRVYGWIWRMIICWGGRWRWVVIIRGRGVADRRRRATWQRTRKILQLLSTLRAQLQLMRELSWDWAALNLQTTGIAKKEND